MSVVMRRALGRPPVEGWRSTVSPMLMALVESGSGTNFVMLMLRVLPVRLDCYRKRPSHQPRSSLAPTAVRIIVDPRFRDALLAKAKPEPMNATYTAATARDTARCGARPAACSVALIDPTVVVTADSVDISSAATRGEVARGSVQ